MVEHAFNPKGRSRLMKPLENGKKIAYKFCKVFRRVREEIRSVFHLGIRSFKQT